jgi:hypothetical protein
MASTATFRTLLQSLSQDLRLMVEQSLGLARAEIGAAVRSTLFYVAIAAAAVVVGFAGLLVLVSAVVLIAVALGLPPWAAATIVGLLMTIGGAGVAYWCITRLPHAGLDLPRTRRSLKETLAWVKAQATA